MSDQLSRYFALSECIRSQVGERKGIDNTPTPEIIENLREGAQSMDRIRDHVGHAIHCDSVYRCPKLNAAVGGAKESAHMQGWAWDIVCPEFGTTRELYAAILESGVQFDKMIIECPDSPSGGWVHISFDPKMRGICLATADGKTYSKV